MLVISLHADFRKEVEGDFVIRFTKALDLIVCSGLL